MYLSLGAPAHLPAQSQIVHSVLGAGVSQQHAFKGYAFTDETTITEDGRYRARVRILGLDGGRRSQRFIDLEIFVNEADAHHRALAAARSWIDAEDGNDRLALPSSFAPLA